MYIRFPINSKLGSVEIPDPAENFNLFNSSELRSRRFQVLNDPIVNFPKN